MRNIYSLFFVISCNSVHTHNYTEINCASMPYNQYRNLVIDHFISVVNNDTLVLNELKFECVNNAMYTKKAIYDKFGKWNEEIYPEGKTRPILVWENLTLFPNDLTKFTVAANGLEIFDIYASVLVFDSENNDLLSETSEYREKLIRYFSDMIKSNDQRERDFYEVYWKTVDPEHWENIKRQR